MSFEKKLFSMMVACDMVSKFSVVEVTSSSDALLEEMDWNWRIIGKDSHFKLSFLVLANSIWPTNFFLKVSCCVVDGLTFDEFLKSFLCRLKQNWEEVWFVTFFWANCVDVVVRSEKIQISVVYLWNLPALIPNIDNAVEENLTSLNWHTVINCDRLW